MPPRPRPKPPVRADNERSAVSTPAGKTDLPFGESPISPRPKPIKDASSGSLLGAPSSNPDDEPEDR